MGVSDKRMRKLMEGRGAGAPGVAGKVGALVATIGAGRWCEEQGSLMRGFAYGILDPAGERYALAELHHSECPACRAYVLLLRGLAAALPPIPGVLLLLGSGAASGAAGAARGRQCRTGRLGARHGRAVGLGRGRRRRGRGRRWLVAGRLARREARRRMPAGARRRRRLRRARRARRRRRRRAPPSRARARRTAGRRRGRGWRSRDSAAAATREDLARAREHVPRRRSRARPSRRRRRPSASSDPSGSLPAAQPCPARRGRSRMPRAAGRQPPGSRQAAVADASAGAWQRAPSGGTPAAEREFAPG